MEIRLLVLKAAPCILLLAASITWVAQGSAAVGKDGAKVFNESALPRSEFVSVQPTRQYTDEEFATLSRKSMHGDAPASFYLSHYYLLGKVVQRDIGKAYELIEMSAKGGYAPAQFYLGFSYESGIGKPKDASKASYWYRLAAQQGDAKAARFLGDLLWSAGNNEGLFWLERAAGLGHPEAQFLLGEIHLNGERVPKDPRRGFELIRESANSGLEDAQFTLAWLYRSGTGHPMDPQEAFFWFCVVEFSGYSRNEAGEAEADQEGKQLEEGKRSEIRERARQWVDSRHKKAR